VKHLPLTFEVDQLVEGLKSASGLLFDPAGHVALRITHRGAISVPKTRQIVQLRPCLDENGEEMGLSLLGATPCQTERAPVNIAPLHCVARTITLPSKVKETTTVVNGHVSSHGIIQLAFFILLLLFLLIELFLNHLYTCPLLESNKRAKKLNLLKFINVGEILYTS
jgi:hypothetical protein